MDKKAKNTNETVGSSSEFSTTNVNGTDKLVKTGDEADEEILEDDWSIWRRIIEGIKCARQDCRGALKEEFLKQLNEETRRQITENSWTTKMRRARLAEDRSIEKPPFLICTCADADEKD